MFDWFYNLKAFVNQLSFLSFSQGFTSKKGVAQHIRGMHLATDSFDCTECDKVLHFHNISAIYSSLNSFIINFKLFVQKYFYTIFNIGFFAQVYKRKLGLQKHVKREHSNDSPKSECPQCGKVKSKQHEIAYNLNHMSSLILHLQKVTYLAQHIKIVHKKEELSHECQVCNKVWKHL